MRLYEIPYLLVSHNANVVFMPESKHTSWLNRSSFYLNSSQHSSSSRQTLCATLRILSFCSRVSAFLSRRVRCVVSMCLLFFLLKIHFNLDVSTLPQPLVLLLGNTCIRLLKGDTVLTYHSFTLLPCIRDKPLCMSLRIRQAVKAFTLVAEKGTS